MAGPESLTLRDQLNGADRLVREITDHLERAFVPQAHQLRVVTRISGEAETSQLEDVTLRSQIDTLLKSDDYTKEMSERLQTYLASIGKEVGKIVSGH